MSDHKTINEQIANWCKHFNGVLNDSCQAGIAYKDVRAGGKLPCLKDEGISDTCPQAVFPTEQEVDEQAAHAMQLAAEFLDRLQNGFCPHCGVKIEAERQIGCCVYALPCWHRLGQGKARTVIP